MDNLTLMSALVTTMGIRVAAGIGAVIVLFIIVWRRKRKSVE